MRFLIKINIKSFMLKLPSFKMPSFNNNFVPMKHISLIIIVSFITAFLTASTTVYLMRSSEDFGQTWRVSTHNNVDKQNNLSTHTNQEDAVVEVVDKVGSSVVSIVATKDLPVIEQKFVNPFGDNSPFNQFFGPFQFQIPQYEQKGTEKKEVAGGTGFIVSQDGLILTNRHVVNIEGAEYTVVTNKNERHPAQVIAIDPVEDLAVIKINKIGLTPLDLGNSDNIKVGQSVIAIGNALGEFQNTVSVGVIAGLSRKIDIPPTGSERGETIEGAIQTDAAINPGNSGGPLLNLKGQVIGINSAIVVGSQNIGFAIPINKAKRDLDSVKSGGKISYPYLGVRYIIITEDLQKKENLPVSYGALVARGDTKEDLAVTPGSPADRVGIQESDIILELNGEKIDADHTLLSLVKEHNIGETVTLTVLSKSITKQVKVQLAERPAGL